MGQEKLYIEKELSWLSFNERVLQEAADKSNPLIERMCFLGIYSNNLDEFYKVRFAELKNKAPTLIPAIYWAKFSPGC